MKQIIAIFFVITIYGCAYSKRMSYRLYRDNIILDSNHLKSTTSWLIPIRQCNSHKDSLIYSFCDLYDMKYSLYDDMSYEEFNNTVGKKIFKKNACFLDVCSHSIVLKTTTDEFNKVKNLDDKEISKRFFINGRSKKAYSGEPLSTELLIALAVLFYNNYVLSWGDDEFIYIRKAPKNSVVKKYIK